MISCRSCQHFLSWEQLHQQQHKLGKVKLMPYLLWLNLASCWFTKCFDTLLVYFVFCDCISKSDGKESVLLHERFVLCGINEFHAVHEYAVSCIVICLFNLYSNCISFNVLYFNVNCCISRISQWCIHPRRNIMLEFIKVKVTKVYTANMPM